MLCGLQGQRQDDHRRQARPDAARAAAASRCWSPPTCSAPPPSSSCKVLGEQIGVAGLQRRCRADGKPDPVDVCRNAVAHAKKTLLDTVILDTAGRLHIDEMPMDELKQIDRQVKPDEVYLVCDAMTGQDAVNSAKAFNDALDLNGVILTKLDGDARGGAALSIKEVTKVPIKFIGVGEKLDRLEEFRPEGMAQRIIGQGDMMGADREGRRRPVRDVARRRSRSSRRSWQKGDFTLDDFRKQFEQMEKMGRMKDMIGSMPGMGEMIPEGEDPEVALKRIQGMIDSMTKEERRDPDIIDLSRRRRIAAGSGTEPHEIKQFLDQFDQVRDADAADGQDEHVAAHQDDDRHGQGGACSARRHDAARRRAAPATARAPRNGPRNARRRSKKTSKSIVSDVTAFAVDRGRRDDSRARWQLDRCLRDEEV